MQSRSRGDIIDIMDAIKGRRSIHHFKRENVEREKLEEIFSVASWAPTHYMKEPWNIRVYGNEGKTILIDAIIRSYQRIGMIASDDSDRTRQTIHSIGGFLQDIPHHALIYFPKTADQIRYEEDYAAVCAFIQNAQLAAWKLGAGMLWTITPFMHDRHFAEELQLDPEAVKIAAIMQIGYPDRILAPKARTSIKEKMTFID